MKKTLFVLIMVFNCQELIPAGMQVSLSDLGQAGVESGGFLCCLQSRLKTVAAPVSKGMPEQSECIQLRQDSDQLLSAELCAFILKADPEKLKIIDRLALKEIKMKYLRALLCSDKGILENLIYAKRAGFNLCADSSVFRASRDFKLIGVTREQIDAIVYAKEKFGSRVLLGVICLPKFAPISKDIIDAMIAAKEKLGMPVRFTHHWIKFFNASRIDQIKKLIQIKEKLGISIRLFKMSDPWNLLVKNLTMAQISQMPNVEIGNIVFENLKLLLMCDNILPLVSGLDFSQLLTAPQEATILLWSLDSDYYKKQSDYKLLFTAVSCAEELDGSGFTSMILEKFNIPDVLRPFYDVEAREFEDRIKNLNFLCGYLKGLKWQRSGFSIEHFPQKYMLDLYSVFTSYSTDYPTTSACFAMAQAYVDTIMVDHKFYCYFTHCCDALIREDAEEYKAGLDYNLAIWIRELLLFDSVQYKRIKCYPQIIKILAGIMYQKSQHAVDYLDIVTLNLSIFDTCIDAKRRALQALDASLHSQHVSFSTLQGVKSYFSLMLMAEKQKIIRGFILPSAEALEAELYLLRTDNSIFSICSITTDQKFYSMGRFNVKGEYQSQKSRIQEMIAVFTKSDRAQSFFMTKLLTDEMAVVFNQQIEQFQQMFFEIAKYMASLMPLLILNDNIFMAYFESCKINYLKSHAMPEYNDQMIKFMFPGDKLLVFLRASIKMHKVYTDCDSTISLNEFERNIAIEFYGETDTIMRFIGRQYVMGLLCLAGIVKHVTPAAMAARSSFCFVDSQRSRRSKCYGPVIPPVSLRPEIKRKPNPQYRRVMRSFNKSR